MAAQIILFFVMLWTQVMEIFDLVNQALQGGPPTAAPHRRRVGLAGFEELEVRELKAYDFLGAAGPVASLPAGFEYQHVESSAVGDGHGSPYAVGYSLSNPNQSALFIGTETAGGVDWSAPIWLPPVGSNSTPRVFAADLIRDGGGKPVILGNSTTSGFSQATSWTLNTAGTGLVPTLHTNPEGTSAFSYLVGGDSAGNYAGAFGSVAAFNTGTSLAAIDGIGGQGSDRYGNIIVGGQGSLGGRFWTLDGNSTWVANTPSLPSWSDAVNFSINEISTNVMGGYIYNPDVDEIFPAVWRNDGHLVSTFNLPGYQVSEIVDDHGTNVVLLNDPNFSSVSYVWAEGWTTPRQVYGDILPALANGAVGIVKDISSGGSVWMTVEAHAPNGTVTSFTSGIASNADIPQEGSWHNPVLAADVNNDGKVTSYDALILADELRHKGAFTLLVAPVGNTLFLDVDANGKVDHNDINRVIDKLFAQIGRRGPSEYALDRMLSPLDDTRTSEGGNKHTLRRVAVAKATATTHLLITLTRTAADRAEREKLLSCPELRTTWSFTVTNSGVTFGGLTDTFDHLVKVRGRWVVKN